MANESIDIGSLARCEAQRMVTGCVACAREHEPIPSGGAMVSAEPGTWCNFAIGVGLDGPFLDGELERIEDFFTKRGVEPRIETSPYISRQALAQLQLRGWSLRAFESLLYRPIRAGELVTPPVATPVDVQVRTVEQSDSAGLQDFARVACSGFTAPGVEPTDAELELCLRTLNFYTSFPFMAYVDGQPASAGVVEVSPTSGYTIAALYALSTLSNFRRRGLQQALIAARLNFAAAHKADVALIGGRPGADTERNVRRMGFETAYTIACLTKPGPGLVSVPG